MQTCEFPRSTVAQAAATDLALLAWADLDSSDEDDTDVLAIQAADEVALMLAE